MDQISLNAALTNTRWNREKSTNPRKSLVTCFTVSLQKIPTREIEITRRTCWKCLLNVVQLITGRPWWIVPPGPVTGALMWSNVPTQLRLWGSSRLWTEADWRAGFRDGKRIISNLRLNVYRYIGSCDFFFWICKKDPQQRRNILKLSFYCLK